MRPFTAVFDSGVGGLTVLRALTRRCPGERFGYFGDNANAPYGSRAPKEIEELVFAAFGRLSRMPLKAAVVACNTATALCIDRLRASFPFPVVGVEPAVRPAARLGGRVLLLATRATLASARVKALLARTGGAVDVFCPEELAGEIERHIFDLSAAGVEACLAGLPRGVYDACVLGCTHYVFVAERISAALGCPVFDGNAGTADHLAKILNICSENCKKTPKNAVFFLGTHAEHNKRVFFSLK